jgi:hypothetical protein
MYLSLKDGNRIPTALDDDGNFKFQTAVAPQSFESIWWGRPDQQKASGEIGHIIWPLKANISSLPPYNFFEYDKFNEIHFKEKRNIIQLINSGKFEEANFIAERLVSLYDFGKIRLGKKSAVGQKIALYKEMCHEASKYRNKRGLSKCNNAMIENERIWLREIIVFTSDKDYLSPIFIASLVIALNDWAYFSRQVYSYRQRRWPNNSLVEIAEGESVFRADRCKNWMLEDLFLIEEVFSTHEIADEIKGLISQVQKGAFNQDLQVAINNFPDNVRRPHEKIKLAELANLFNGLNQIRRKTTTGN